MNNSQILSRLAFRFLLCALAPLSSPSSFAADSREFSDIRWGFTTVNFLPHVPVSVESTKAHIDFAKGLGLEWIELRDPDAVLTPEECREIAAHARRAGIEVNYSTQRGLLAEDFWDVFERALANTALFDGPRIVRVLALRGGGDHGWNDEELAQMVKAANEAAARAKSAGLRLAVENADSAPDGRGKAYHGMTEFLSATQPGVLLQLDTANLFTGPVETTPEAAADFIRTFADRTAYVHLKSARNAKPLPWIAGNPLGFREILGILAGRGPLPVALEFAPAEDTAAVRRNTEESLETLAKDGLRGAERTEAP